jgi:hypothetical protein
MGDSSAEKAVLAEDLLGGTKKAFLRDRDLGVQRDAFTWEQRVLKKA